MGTWKKMAEAFGRAFGQNNGPIKEDLSDTELSVLKAFDRHRDDAIGDEFRRGARYGIRDRADAETRAETLQDAGERGSLKDLTGKELDHINDVRTDKNLRKNVFDEWDEAFARRKQGVRDWYGKDYPQDMAEEGAEAFEKQLWEYVGQLRAKGIPAQDILNRLKGND